MVLVEGVNVHWYPCSLCSLLPAFCHDRRGSRFLCAASPCSLWHYLPAFEDSVDVPIYIVTWMGAHVNVVMLMSTLRASARRSCR